jgi:outer membrane protein OmpA-like peptidoglycan-associated protein
VNAPAEPVNTTGRSDAGPSGEDPGPADAGIPDAARMRIVVPPEERFTMTDFTFPEKSAEVPPSLFPALDGVVKYLEDHPRQRLLVMGRSEWGESRKLAEARARATIEYFVSKGLSRERFDAEGRPAKEPPHGERMPWEREYERRVHFRILIDEGSSEP